MKTRVISLLSVFALALFLTACGGGGSSSTTTGGGTTQDYTFTITPLFPNGLTYDTATGTLMRHGVIGATIILQAGDTLDHITILVWDESGEYPMVIRQQRIDKHQINADGTWTAVFTLESESDYIVEIKVTMYGGEEMWFQHKVKATGVREIFINANLEVNFGPTVGISGKFLMEYDEPSTTLTASANDPDGDALTYLWSTSCSMSSATGQQVTIFKGSSSSCYVTVVVTDARGAFAYDEDTLNWKERGSGTPIIINVGDVFTCSYRSQWTTFLNEAQADQETVEGTYSLTSTASGTLSGTGYGGVGVSSAGQITWMPSSSWPISGTYDNDAATVALFELAAAGRLEDFFNNRLEFSSSGSMGPGLTYTKTGTTGCSKQ